MRRWVLGGAAVLAALVIGCGGDGGDGGGSQLSLARIRVAHLGFATLLYANDADDQLMLGSNWMDALTPYVSDPEMFRSPAVPAPGYGFALNAAIAGASLNALDPNTVSIFDSTVLGRNAVASLDTLPNPGRYDGSNAQSTLSQGNPDLVDPTPLDLSLSRVKQNSTAMILYFSDYDDRMPQSGTWMDALKPYAKGSDTTFRTPRYDGTEAWGYAFNDLLPGASSFQIEAPASTVGIFDANTTARNAETDPSNRPTPGRYDGRNAVGYADGHVSALSP